MSVPRLRACRVPAAAAMAMRQTPLTCSGHTRPVVDLAFSGVTPYGYFLISACKGERGREAAAAASVRSVPLLCSARQSCPRPRWGCGERGWAGLLLRPAARRPRVAFRGGVAGAGAGWLYWGAVFVPRNAGTCRVIPATGVTG